MGKVYTVISGKGGVGKTTSAINIGSSMNSYGKEVIIVDANLSTPNIGLHLGSPIVPITLNHVINYKAKPEEAIYEHESGTKIMPSSLSIGELKEVNHERLIDISKKLRKISDHIILDASAGLGEEALSAMRAADEIIIVTNPEISAVTDALKTIKIAEKLEKKIIGVIISRHEGKDWEMDILSIKDMLEVRILGIVPEDEAIRKSQKLKNAVVLTHPKSKAAKAYQRITQKILGPEFEKEESRKRAQESRISGKKSFISKLWGKLTGKK